MYKAVNHSSFVNNCISPSSPVYYTIRSNFYSISQLHNEFLHQNLCNTCASLRSGLRVERLMFAEAGDFRYVYLPQRNVCMTAYILCTVWWRKTQDVLAPAKSTGTHQSDRWAWYCCSDFRSWMRTIWGEEGWDLSLVLLFKCTIRKLDQDKCFPTQLSTIHNCTSTPNFTMLYHYLHQ